MLCFIRKKSQVLLSGKGGMGILQIKIIGTIITPSFNCLLSFTLGHATKFEKQKWPNVIILLQKHEEQKCLLPKVNNLKSNLSFHPFSSLAFLYQLILPTIEYSPHANNSPSSKQQAYNQMTHPNHYKEDPDKRKAVTRLPGDRVMKGRHHNQQHTS